MKHNRDGEFFKRMGKPTKKVVTLKEYLKFFHVISKAKGDDTFQKILKHVHSEVPVWVKKYEKKKADGVM